MSKINLFFSCEILIDQFFIKSSRSGIFFTIWNTLQIMHKNENLQISLAYPSEYTWSKKLQKLKEHPFFSQFKFVRAGLGHIDEVEILFRINEHKKNGSYIKIFYNYLRLLYNYLRLIKYRMEEIFYCKKESFKDTQIYLSPFYPIPRKILKQRHIKKIYILYDAIPILQPDFFKANFNASDVHTMLIETFDKDTYAFCISQSCKDDFLKCSGDKLDEHKMFVTHIATNQNYVPDYNKQELIRILKKYNAEHNPNDNYLFSLCSLEPRKNLPFTISCFFKFIKKHNIQNLYFYLGGSVWKKFESVLAKILEEAGEFKHKVKLLGYIDDCDLNILYSNSLFFTYLSQYEGFGMPPLEAMQAGTPVITSNNSSLPEVVGDAAISVICNDELAVIKAFEDFYFNENLREEYIAKGLERAKMFSWEKCVGQMIHSIEDIVR